MDQELRSLSIVLNKKYGFVACLKCGYKLTGKVANHFKNVHREMLTQITSTIEEKIQNYLKNKEFIPIPTTTSSPIQGIKIVSGFKCQTCGKFAKNGVTCHKQGFHCKYQKPSLHERSLEIKEEQEQQQDQHRASDLEKVKLFQIYYENSNKIENSNLQKKY